MSHSQDILLARQRELYELLAPHARVPGKTWTWAEAGTGVGEISNDEIIRLGKLSPNGKNLARQAIEYNLVEKLIQEVTIVEQCEGILSGSPNPEDDVAHDILVESTSKAEEKIAALRDIMDPVADLALAETIREVESLLKH